MKYDTGVDNDINIYLYNQLKTIIKIFKKEAETVT